MNASAITVVGGSYGEECSYPSRQIYRGSGGRAAAVLSSLGANVTLNTVTGPLLSSIFHSIAANIGYSLDTRSSPEDIWFRYRYPLGHPTIFPAFPKTISDDHVVKTDIAISFGMIEGRPIVHAKRAVYDPQDGSKSQHFDANGSSAEELAMVVSYSEGKALSNETNPERIAEKLLAKKNVKAVVVKCGPQGALVKTNNMQGWVRAFPTRRVYKIGSGDVFSAAFAFAWLLQNQDALSAAWFASRVTATYVETALDSFTTDQITGFQADASAAAIKYRNAGARNIPATQIYLAGPFFNTAQQWLIDEVRGALTDMGFNVFSPIHDVGLGPAEEVAPADLFGLDQSGLVLALLDGLDAGTIFEVGYARSKNISVVAVAESVDSNSLSMILGSGCEVTNDLTTGIYTACWHLMGDV
jgi:hypothetical protein